MRCEQLCDGIYTDDCFSFVHQLGWECVHWYSGKPVYCFVKECQPDISSSVLKRLPTQRKCTSVAHTIIFFISPIMLAIAVCIYQKHASRKLINILSTLGFSDKLQGGTKMISFYIRVGEWWPFLELEHIFTVWLSQKWESSCKCYHRKSFLWSQTKTQ